MQYIIIRTEETVSYSMSILQNNNTTLSHMAYFPVSYRFLAQLTVAGIGYSLSSVVFESNQKVLSYFQNICAIIASVGISC